MQTDIPSLLASLGLLAPDEQASATPLPGGVSSDIVLVTTSTGRRFCVKRALARLKVTTLWEAPVGRNAAEANWIRTVARWLPGAVPALIAEIPEHGLFVMDYLPADTHPVWKGELVASHADAAFAAEVGMALVSIHARSAGEKGLSEAFANEATFEAIRIEPYLRATARAHPDLAARLESLIEQTLATRLSLIHGDVSPKNILHGPDGPVFLDAECACWGDPAFDLAFCLTHLLLKGVLRDDRLDAYLLCYAALAEAYLRGLRDDRLDAYLLCYAALAEAYLRGVTWEAPVATERRASGLVQAFLLARIDGRSPVEYLDEPQRERVRRAARAMLLDGTGRLSDIAGQWSRHHA